MNNDKFLYRQVLKILNLVINRRSPYLQCKKTINKYIMKKEANTTVENTEVRQPETTNYRSTSYNSNQKSLKPTRAFISASWFTLITGIVAYCIGLNNASMALNEKGYYLVVLLFGLFSVISVQKSVRDRAEGIEVTELYYGISWFTSIASILFLTIGLWKADLETSEKGFYGMSYLLSLYSAIAVQKNTRDTQFLNKQ